MSFCPLMTAESLEYSFSFLKDRACHVLTFERSTAAWSARAAVTVKPWSSATRAFWMISSCMCISSLRNMVCCTSLVNCQRKSWK